MSSEEVKKVDDLQNKQSSEFEEEKQQHRVTIAPGVKRFVQITTVTVLFIMTAVVLSAAIVLIVLNPRIGKDFEHICRQRYCYRLDYTDLTTGGDSSASRLGVLENMAASLASTKVGAILLYKFPLNLVSDANSMEQNKKEIARVISAYSKQSIAVYVAVAVDANKALLSDQVFINLVALGVTGFIFNKREFKEYEKDYYNLLFVSMPKDDTVLTYLKHYTSQKYPVVLLESETLQEFMDLIGPTGANMVGKVDYLLVPYNSATAKALFDGGDKKTINPLASRVIFVVSGPDPAKAAAASEDALLSAASDLIHANYLSDVGVAIESGFEVYADIPNYGNYTSEINHHAHMKNKMLETLEQWNALVQFYPPFKQNCLAVARSGLLGPDAFIGKKGVNIDSVFGFYKVADDSKEGGCGFAGQTYLLLVNRDPAKNKDLTVNLSLLPANVLPANKDKKDLTAYAFFDIPMTFSGFSLGKAYKLDEFNMTLANALMVQLS